VRRLEEEKQQVLSGVAPAAHAPASRGASPGEETRALQHTVRMLREEVSTLQLQLDQQADAHAQQLQRLQGELDGERRNVWKAQDERDELHKLCNARDHDLDVLRDDKLRLQVRLPPLRARLRHGASHLHARQTVCGAAALFWCACQHVCIANALLRKGQALDG
jgi:chromosome segregation ATPase